MTEKTHKLAMMIRETGYTADEAANLLDEWFDERLDTIMRALQDVTRAVDSPVERGPMLPGIEE